jgi:hypothetical protein
MASVSSRPGGLKRGSGKPVSLKRVQFSSATGKRVTIYLGDVTQKQAQAVATKIEALVATQVTGHAPDMEVSKWIEGLDERLMGKLVNVGLLASRETIRLKAWCDRFIVGRSHLKPTTIVKYEAVRDKLVENFGSERDVRTITLDEAPLGASGWRRAN